MPSRDTFTQSFLTPLGLILLVQIHRGHPTLRMGSLVQSLLVNLTSLPVIIHMGIPMVGEVIMLAILLMGSLPCLFKLTILRALPRTQVPVRPLTIMFMVLLVVGLPVVAPSQTRIILFLGLLKHPPHHRCKHLSHNRIWQNPPQQGQVYAQQNAPNPQNMQQKKKEEE